MVVVGPVSMTGFSWIDGAFEAASSSESSELKPARGISEMTGRGGALGVASVVEVVILCFFFGCGSSVGCDRCFDRTGTGVVVRVVERGNSGTGLSLVGPSRAGVGGLLTTDMGLRALTLATRYPVSSRGVPTIVRGRRFGSGFKIMWVGRPA